MRIVADPSYRELLVEDPSMMMKLEPTKGFDVTSIRNSIILSSRIMYFKYARLAEITFILSVKSRFPDPQRLVEIMPSYLHLWQLSLIQ